ncbi:hypothetical protein SDC9_163785 [bioreactor metagenome]|uniref:Uncharacterized protein n=1 Tax=bioreactor metagenome TaxID=1076179 RepID=A0A645FPU8_9ZZZZ
MFFLKLRHVDSGEVLTPAVEQFRQLQHGFGFADTARPGQQECTKRASWTTQISTRR